jgi:DNA invertase Pin-like site-specific DNA recombinase
VNVDGRRAPTRVLGGVRPRLIGYTRIPVGGPPRDLEQQAAAIRRGARRDHWEVCDLLTEEISGADLVRPVLSSAFARIDAGDADGLVVARLDRLACSLAHFGQLLRDARQRGWALVVLDVDVDLSHPVGRRNAQAFEKAADVERQLVAMRTTEALVAKRTAGVRLGRPRACPDAVLEQVVGAHVRGIGLRQIADELNRQGTPTPGGGARWYASHVSRLLKTQDAIRLIQDRAASTIC